MLKVKDGVNGNSTTATTLQNARTINGTNFDGSANITTSNWGTARTITIGSTGKSVNGSGNVNWTLAEIGAAKAYTSANGYEGITLSDGTTSNWLRTTSNGIIPYQSGGSGSLGTSSWPFNTVYAKTLYENGTALSNKYAAASHTHDSIYVKYNGANSLSTILSPSTDNTYDLGKVGYRWKTIYGMAGWYDSSLTISSDDASNTGWKLHGEQTSDGNYYSKLIALHKDSTYGLIQFHHNNNDFLFSGSLHPTSNDNYTYVGIGDKRWKGAYFKEEINSWNGSSGYQFHHFASGTNLSAFTLSCLDRTGEASAAIYLYNDGAKYLSPVTDCDIGLGRHGQAYRDVWAAYGTIQTCDANAKENIKLISQNNISKYAKASDEDNITEDDIYNFIKNINVYSYNYKSFTENKNENIKSNETVESAKQLGVLAQELKEADEKIWEYIGINADEEKESMAAIKQGSINGLLLSGLKIAINKIEKLQNEIELIKDGVN